MTPPPVNLELPGASAKTFTDLVLDFTGTLSQDGKLLPEIAERLVEIATHLRIVVLTADTFGTARSQLQELPVQVQMIDQGADKAAFVRQLGAAHVIAIGNGRNDVAMVKLAGLGIAVIGSEGAAGELLGVADVVVQDVRDALDAITNPLRLKATLRD
jgi:soluble P-type ATPase